MAAVSVATLACESNSPRDSWPAPPIPAPRIVSISEWEAAYPKVIDHGTFEYDSEGRLTRHDFGRLENGVFVKTMYVEYLYEADRLMGVDTWVRNGDAFVQSQERLFQYSSSGLPISDSVFSLHEATGAIRIATSTYRYDAAGRVVEHKQSGGGRDLFAYDDVGNLSQRVSYEGDVVLTTKYEYERSFNPVAHPGRAYDGVNLPLGSGRGIYNVRSWQTSLPGQAPASVAFVTFELDARRYPTRRTIEIRNASTPENPIVYIATFVY